MSEEVEASVVSNHPRLLNAACIISSHRSERKPCPRCCVRMYRLYLFYLFIFFLFGGGGGGEGLGV